jgi:S-DNA-T family DNA segregation ATPase FtsK/SpoIIIE
MAADPNGAILLLNKFEDALTQRLREVKSTECSYTRMQLPYLLFICADADLTERHNIMRYLTRNDSNLGIGAIFLYNDISRLPKECSVIIDVSSNNGTKYSRDYSDIKEHFILEGTGRNLLDRFARSMAPIRVESMSAEGQLPTSISFLQGYGVKKPGELPIESNWYNSLPNRTMSVPIGIKANGELFNFDIHEKAYGPHGLVAGMTGSGKSEMVQSWILSMAVKYSPQAVSFVLIDFKGTGLILPFRNLPHLAGTISDLDTSIGRNLIALENELARRKSLLDQHGVSNIAGYLNLLSEGKVSTPLSYLFVVIDEFAEFRVRFPDFMQVVDRIFAIGRTLGVHIILLTQKPANIVNDKMNANTRFRWCLKVASSSDSKDMLRHPDAAKITVPGRAYVQVGEDEVYEQIQSFWSGAPYNPERDPAARHKEKISIVDLSGNRMSYETEKTTGFRAEKNEIDAIVEHLDNHVRKNHLEHARSIWTNKLPEQLSLNSIINIAFDGEKWNNTDTDLYIPVGMIDDPRSQSQYPLRLAPHEDGHFALYGAPGTGKTTFLQTVILSMALSYSPEQVNIYIKDFGGGSMGIFKDLPHLGGIAVSGEDEKIDKLSKLLSNELGERRRKFAALGIVSIESYREASGERLPYIVLVLDNFAPVLGMYPNLENFFITLTRDGGSYGIYLFVTAGNTMNLSFRISQNIKSTAALNMADKNDYAAIVGRTNGFEPENFPGRGLVKETPPLEFQTALPTSGRSENERISSIRNLTALMNTKWLGKRPGNIPVMPERVTLDMFSSDDIYIGFGVDDIRPVKLPYETEPFTIISSASARGNASTSVKSELLQALVNQFRKKMPDASIATFDSEAQIDDYIESLIPHLNERKNAAPESKNGFTPILIVLNDIGTVFETVSNETMNRLAAIVTLGRGLNVYLLTAGETDDISKLYHGDKFIMSMVDKAAAILVGGNFRTHLVFKADLSYTESENALASDEGYLLVSGRATKIKIVQGE